MLCNLVVSHHIVCKRYIKYQGGIRFLFVIIMMDIKELNQLTVKEILRVCGSEAFSVPSIIRKNKLQLLELIISSAPSPVVSALSTLIQQQKSKQDTTSQCKRKSGDAQLDSTHRTEKNVQCRISYDYEPIPERNEYQNTRFLDLPTNQETQHSYSQFYEATSDVAVRLTVCGVCAREVL